MQITKLQPVADRGGGRARTLAIFSVDVADGIRLHGCRLAQMPDGTLRVHGQAADGANPYSFSPAANAALIDAANAALKKGPTAYDRARA